MNGANYRVRRATLDDLQALTALWQSMQFAPDDLVRRVTEFQVAEGPDGTVVGAIGLQVAERQGRLHSEAFADFSLAESVRPLFWERVRTLATNLGLLRLWTQESAPFWSRCGLIPADPQALEKLPPLWRALGPSWLTLRLHEDLDAIVSADKEFALFMQAEKQRSARAIQQARTLKTVATVVAVIFLLLIMGSMLLMMFRNPRFMGH